MKIKGQRKRELEKTNKVRELSRVPGEDKMRE